MNFGWQGCQDARSVGCRPGVQHPTEDVLMYGTEDPAKLHARASSDLPAFLRPAGLAKQLPARKLICFRSIRWFQSAVSMSSDSGGQFLRQQACAMKVHHLSVTETHLCPSPELPFLESSGPAKEERPSDTALNVFVDW